MYFRLEFRIHVIVWKCTPWRCVICNILYVRKCKQNSSEGNDQRFAIALWLLCSLRLTMYLARSLMLQITYVAVFITSYTLALICYVFYLLITHCFPVLELGLLMGDLSILSCRLRIIHSSLFIPTYQVICEGSTIVLEALPSGGRMLASLVSFYDRWL